MSKSPCLNPFEHILHVSVHDKILRKWNGNLNDLCSKSLKPRQALYDSVHSSWRTRDKWISVEEAKLPGFTSSNEDIRLFQQMISRRPSWKLQSFWMLAQICHIPAATRIAPSSMTIHMAFATSIASGVFGGMHVLE